MSQTPAHFVAAGEDQTGKHHGLGISVIDFKVISKDSGAVARGMELMGPPLPIP